MSPSQPVRPPSSFVHDVLVNVAANLVAAGIIYVGAVAAGYIKGNLFLLLASGLVLPFGALLLRDWLAGPPKEFLGDDEVSKLLREKWETNRARERAKLREALTRWLPDMGDLLVLITLGAYGGVLVLVLYRLVRWLF